MRDTYDCVVIRVPGHGDWLMHWLKAQQADVGREFRPGTARLYSQTPTACTANRSDVEWLRDNALALRRFDACLLPVEPATLSWVRTALAAAQPVLATPVLALTTGVGVIGLADLLPLGMADFFRPDSVDELRLRLALVTKRASHRSLSATTPVVAGPRVGSADVASLTTVRHSADPSDVWVYDVANGYFYDGEAANAWTKGSLDEPSVSDTLLHSKRDTWCHAAETTPPGAAQWPVGLPREVATLIETPFGQAKARVVGNFERAYLQGSLARHAGNVTQAARAAAKHRRAFWALMRKHRIQAAPYREWARERQDRQL